MPSDSSDSWENGDAEPTHVILPPCRRRWRRRRAIVSVVTGIVILFVAATLQLFVFPTTDAPSRVNAVVLIGGVAGGEERAFRLVRAGFAPRLVVSTPRNIGCPANNITNVEVICFNPNPISTQGEARAIGRLAAQNHWTRILVITRQAQDTRARIRIGRCYHGSLLVNPVEPSLRQWPYQIAYEWGALAKALTLQRGC